MNSAPVISRIAMRDDGTSAFEDVEIDFEISNENGRETAIVPAHELYFVETPAGLEMDFHNASRQRLILVLGGRLEIEAGSGERRIFGPGSIINPMDTEGRGHKTRTLDGLGLSTVLIELGEKVGPAWPAMTGNQPDAMGYTRCHTGADDRSHFEDESVVYSIAAPLGPATEAFSLKGYQITLKPGDLDHEYHNAPARQFVIALTGGMEVETGGGEIRRYAPGDIFLGEDTEGQGHITRAIGGAERLSVFALLA